jgi:hypothetical protein
MGSALSGIATIATGQAKASADAQAATQDQQDEERVLRYNALQAGEKGRFEAGKLRMSGAMLAAKQKVAYAASGVDSTVGTAASVQANTAALTELDAMTAENNAAREVWGYKLQVQQSKKNLQRKYEQYNREAIGSALSGAGQIIGGAGGVGGGSGGG